MVLHLDLRLRLYAAAVCSIMVYGSEGWLLNERVCKMLNGANAKMLSRITGKTCREEATEGTRSFDLVSRIRARRIKWVGHILRIGDKDRLIRKALRVIYDNRQEGDILMDVPSSVSWEELEEVAADRDKWRLLVRMVKG